MSGGFIVSGSTTVQFITLKGNFQSAGQQLDDITRPGVDGSAYRKTGVRGKPYELTGTVDVANAAALATLEQTLRDIQGTICTVTDDYGNAQYGLALIRFEVTEQRALVKAVGGLNAPSAYLFSAKFTFVDTNPPD